MVPIYISGHHYQQITLKLKQEINKDHYFVMLYLGHRDRIGTLLMFTT
jgi:hypothetical protein